MYKKPKIVSAKDAIKNIKSGDLVVFSPACGEPTTIINALLEEKDRFKDVKLFSTLLLSNYSFAKKEYEGHFRFITSHATSTIKEAIADGRVDFLPIRYSEIPIVFSPNGPYPVNVAIIHTSPPDNFGYMSLGVSVSFALPIAFNADVVIAEVNRNMPRTLGNSFIHISDIDYIVETDSPLIEYPSVYIGEREKKIAEFVSPFIKDGTTLQIGIGSIPEAILKYLDDKKDIGLHTGMMLDGMIPLIEKGVINNKKKSINKGKIVVGEVMGTKGLFEFVHNNPLIHMETTGYFHNLKVIENIENLVSINSALEVDITGQINAESIGTTQVSGVGGLFDFIEGAYYSKDSTFIIAITSTDSSLSRSKIVSRFKPGTVTTIPRYFTQYIITEYGVADLRYKSIKERVEALINIAHPNFRNKLWEEFKEMIG
jgi:4-hydroxybutyrate CoA-transferase